MLVKLTLREQASADPVRAVGEMILVVGGLIKAEGAVLLHYTGLPADAKAEWRKRGFVVVAEETVELGPEGLERLLRDLEKL